MCVVNLEDLLTGERKEPFCHKSTGIEGQKTFIIPEAKIANLGQSLEGNEPICLQVIDTGTYITDMANATFSRNSYSYEINPDGDLVIEFANDIGEVGSPAWIEVHGFVCVPLLTPPSN